MSFCTLYGLDKAELENQHDSLVTSKHGLNFSPNYLMCFTLYKHILCINHCLYDNLDFSERIIRLSRLFR